MLHYALRQCRFFCAHALENDHTANHNQADNVADMVGNHHAQAARRHQHPEQRIDGTVQKTIQSRGDAKQSNEGGDDDENRLHNLHGHSGVRLKLEEHHRAEGKDVRHLP